ncbi:substrate-binding domain-containing protein [Streptomyces sp. NPDC090106]|uniref:substrate-binding domain-containing protein n=1 Tax=Streptomyces sp. NPDC090106 TaxID=3365946 RepID=UPI00380A35DF
MTDMLVTQRREKLIGELKSAGGLKVTELASRLRVSRATVRRDLLDLEAEGRISRVRGGALLSTEADAPQAAGEPAVRSAPVAFPVEGEQSLGLLVPSATYYYPRVVAGVQAAAARRGARIIISLSDYTQDEDARRIEELAESGVAGLLIASPGGHDLPDAAIRSFESSGLPFVLMERQPQDPYSACEFVVTDHQQGAYAAVRHLVGLGHERVALFTNGSPTADLVAQGHQAAVEQLCAGRPVPVVDSGRPSQDRTSAEAHYTRFVDACLAQGVTAALIHSDHDAIEVLRQLRTRGLRVPEDMALIAYDDEIAGLADVPLTAVAPPKQELGEQAAHMLLDRLSERGSGLPVRQTYLQPRLVLRGSTEAVRN